MARGHHPAPRGPTGSQILVQRMHKKEGMAQFTEDRDGGKAGGGDGMNRGDGTDSEEDQGQVLKMKPQGVGGKK